MKAKITKTIRKTIPRFLKENSLGGIWLDDPYDINCGLCEDFAQEVIQQIAGGETSTLFMVWIEDLKGTPFPDASHAVICWKNGNKYMYFDAECPEGTSDVRKIPAMANQKKTREEVIEARK
jgi:hypothetical protein